MGETSLPPARLTSTAQGPAALQNSPTQRSEPPPATAASRLPQGGQASAPAGVDAAEPPRPRAPSATASAGTGNALAAPGQPRRSAAEEVGGAFKAVVQARVDAQMAIANGPAAQAMVRGINNALAWVGLPTIPERPENR